ncbi:LacI family DNA-binding transcriptional regulator [Thermoanaerobacter thermohydrosulfuricus]|nr:LacI family transcriptional regulator [Clostridia bacterium]
MSNTKRFSITIDYVAQKAGVSKTTISRYINGHYEYMSSETRERIKKVIEELDYRPNKLARSLKSNKSHLIGVLVADISNPFSSILVRGIGDVCKQHDYNIIIANTDNDPKKEKEYILSMIDQRVEGLIINTTGEIDEFLLEVGNNGMPIVLADRSIKTFKFDTVVVNNYEVTSELIKHLIDNGFMKIGFFTEEIKNISTRLERKRAFLDTCLKYLNRDVNDMIIVIDTERETSVIEGLRQLLEKSEKEKVAAFGVNGVVLLSLLQGISKLNLKIPQDIGVCGYDDWGWAALIPPGITTISQPSYQVGVESAKRLISRIKQKRNSKPKLITLSANLVIRGSTVLTI